eukprot:3178671-Pyramimonas_sp.AAC.1
MTLTKQTNSFSIEPEYETEFRPLNATGGHFCDYQLYGCPTDRVKYEKSRASATMTRIIRIDLRP